METKECSSCQTCLSKDQYSKTQWKKPPTKRRCLGCVEGKTTTLTQKQQQEEIKTEIPNNVVQQQQEQEIKPEIPNKVEQQQEKKLSRPKEQEGLGSGGSDTDSLGTNHEEQQHGEEDEKKTTKNSKALCRKRLIQAYPFLKLGTTGKACRIWYKKELKEDLGALSERIGEEFGWKVLEKHRKAYAKWIRIALGKQGRDETFLDKLLDKFAGKEEQLFEFLVKDRELVFDWSKQEILQPPASKKRKHEAVSSSSNTCDKCDGKHDTNACPYYKKARENHPDAQRRKMMSDLGGDGGNVFVHSSNARIRRQPGDGSCLYHSLSYGIGGGMNAYRLRRVLAQWVREHKQTKIAGTPMSDWVKWDQNSTVQAYTRRMESSSSWGGGIEMAAASRHFNVNVHVYEYERGGYKRISCFNVNQAKKTVNVLYCGGIHFDAIDIHGKLTTAPKQTSKKLHKFSTNLKKNKMMMNNKFKRKFKN